MDILITRIKFGRRFPYARFHRERGHMRRAYAEFCKALITKPKPYFMEYKDGCH